MVCTPQKSAMVTRHLMEACRVGVGIKASRFAAANNGIKAILPATANYK